MWEKSKSGVEKKGEARQPGGSSGIGEKFKSQVKKHGTMETSDEKKKKERTKILNRI